MPYIAKHRITHGTQEILVGDPMPDLTEVQAAELLALGAIEPAPETTGDNRSKAKKAAAE
jgi:hypothetical protein